MVFFFFFDYRKKTVIVVWYQYSVESQQVKSFIFIFIRINIWQQVFLYNRIGHVVGILFWTRKNIIFLGILVIVSSKYKAKGMVLKYKLNLKSCSESLKRLNTRRRHG